MKKTTRTLIFAIIMILLLAIIIYMLLIFGSVYNKSKSVKNDELPTIIRDEAIQEPAVNNSEQSEIENKQDSYVSPYNEDYGRSVETIFVNTIKNSNNNIYKDILTNCETMGYQISLSTSNGYTITSRNSSIDSLNIIVDTSSDEVRSATINYADMLVLTYNANANSNKFIFENTEQGKVEYFDSVIEATDTLMSEIDTHKYNPNAILTSDINSSDWASTVTPATDTTQFTGLESLDSITVPSYFDANYYQIMNPDVVQVLGNDPRELYRHYIMHGKAEGRQYALDTTQPIQEVSVYITSVGNHYHRNNCKFIDGDINKVSLDYANMNGYKKCPICNP